jgi:hypothetical protein
LADLAATGADLRARAVMAGPFDVEIDCVAVI